MNADIPADEQAEKCILGTLLQGKSFIDALAAEIEPEGFLFRAITDHSWRDSRIVRARREREHYLRYSMPARNT